MKEVYIGKIVNTHGIKGELRIISDFKYKDVIFKPDFILYVGKNKKPFTIISYRKHKNYDMVLFSGINDINEALPYKGESVYINRDDLNIDGYINEDLINLDVYSKDKYLGKVLNIINNGAHEILVIDKNGVKNLIPFVDEFINKIDIQNKKIYINEIEGLINED